MKGRRLGKSEGWKMMRRRITDLDNICYSSYLFFYDDDSDEKKKRKEDRERQRTDRQRLEKKPETYREGGKEKRETRKLIDRQTRERQIEKARGVGVEKEIIFNFNNWK